MKAVTLAGALTLVLLAVPALAQDPPATQQKPPAQQPAQKPAAPATQPAPPPKPFPEGAKIAYVDIQRIAAESKEGQAASKKVNDLQQQKLAELNEKNKQLQTAQTKLQSGGLLSDDARAQAQKEVDRLQVEIQRAQQDAQTAVDELQTELQRDFQRKLMPVIEQVATERQLLMLFTAEAGIVWADRGLDLTADVIKRFDAPAAPPK